MLFHLDSEDGPGLSPKMDSGISKQKKKEGKLKKPKKVSQMVSHLSNVNSQDLGVLTQPFKQISSSHPKVLFLRVPGYTY